MKNSFLAGTELIDVVVAVGRANRHLHLRVEFLTPNQYLRTEELGEDAPQNVHATQLLTCRPDVRVLLEICADDEVLDRAELVVRVVVWTWQFDAFDPLLIDGHGVKVDVSHPLLWKRPEWTDVVDHTDP